MSLDEPAAKAARRQRPACSPFLKWAGGKWDLLAKLRPHLLEKPRRYFEPFIGGGSVFFGCYPGHRPALLSDSNERVVNTYVAVRDDVEKLIEYLSLLTYDEERFYAIRKRFNEERDAHRVLRAAWMIYLNRTCANGLYRENGDGEFNVSFGAYDNPTICDVERLRACSAALQGVDLQVCDFALITALAQEGDLVYLDPPYIPLPGSPSFTSYRADGFSWPVEKKQLSLIPEPPTDHERLAAEVRALDKRGVRFVLSNSDTPLSRALLDGAGFTIERIEATRSIGFGADRREPAPEIIVSNLRMAA